MKKYYWRSATALLACAGLFMASCSDSDDGGEPLPEPNFPKLIEAPISLDEPYTFTVRPNMDWEVSIPTTGEDASWFYIQNGETMDYKIRGNANEERSITIAVRGVDEFDTDRVCRVSMTMNNQTQEIAVLTRYRQQRALEVFIAQRAAGEEAEWTLFAQDEEGNYLYENEAATGIELITLPDEFNYMQRFKINANYPWVIAEAPDWLTFSGDVNSGEVGTTPLFVMDAPEKHPFEATDGAIRFNDVTDLQNPVETGSISISIPGCKDYIGTSIAATELFNAEGGYYYTIGGSFGDAESGVYKSFSAAYGCEIFFVVGDADGNLSVGDSSSWLHFASGMTWDDAAKEAGVWDHTLQIICSANTGKARTAYLIAIPRGKVPADFSRSSVIDGTAIADAYAEYVVSTITQNGAAGKFVEIPEAEVGDKNMFSFTQLSTSDWPFEGNWAAVPEGYNLTYKSELSYEHAPLKFNGTYASYDVYDEQGPYGTPLTNPWVELVDNAWLEGAKNIRIAGSYNDATGAWEWACERPANTTAYFAFKDAQGNIVAVIEFVLEEETGSDEVLSLYEETPTIELKQIFEGDADFDPDTTCPQYKMTFTDYDTATAKIVVDSDGTQYSEGEVAVMNAGAYKILQFPFENPGDKGMIILSKNSVPVCCIYTEYQPGGGTADEEVSIVGDVTATFLSKLSAADADYDPEMDCPQYKLTFTSYDEYSVTLNLPEHDSSQTYIEDEESVNLQGTMLINYMETAGKTEVILKKNYMQVCRIVVEYQPA